MTKFEEWSLIRLSSFFKKVNLFAIIVSIGTLEKGIFELGKICIMLNCKGDDDFYPTGRIYIQPRPDSSETTCTKLFQSS
jgi:hypothetical protein